MNTELNNLESSLPGAEKSVAWRFFGKWLLVSAGVLVVLVVIESVLVEIKDQPHAPNARRSFENYAEFIDYQKSLGYVFLGRFQDAWPAEIIEERTSGDDISFQLSNGTRHNYPKIDGYELKLVRLATGRGTEAVVVLRSAAKK